MAKLTKFDPFQEMRSLQRQFFGDDWDSNLIGSVSNIMPTTDVYTRDDKEMVVEAHLPHFDEKDVDVNIDKGSLVIRADKTEKDEDKKKYVVRESSSSFYRRIHLPEHADEDKIDAHLEDGILKVTIQFKEQPKPKKISVKRKK